MKKMMRQRAIHTCFEIMLVKFKFFSNLVIGTKKVLKYALFWSIQNGNIKFIILFTQLVSINALYLNAWLKLYVRVDNLG